MLGIITTWIKISWFFKDRNTENPKIKGFTGKACYIKDTTLS